MTEEAYRSGVAQGLFHVDGKPLSLEHYPMFYGIYDGKFPRMLLKTSRQVGKSTTIAAFMIAESISIPMFKTYYVSPSREQTLKFSHTRVAKILAYSPELRRNFVGAQSIDNVLLRTLRNGSEMAFTYADDDPDRARGYSADRVAIDEVQAVTYDSVIPVLEECFDQRTDVLTSRGWVNVASVTQKDLLADVNDSGFIEWHAPSRIIHKRHTGTMVHFTHDWMSLRVTGDHAMWLHPRGETRQLHKDVWQFRTAKSLVEHDKECFRLTSTKGLPDTKAPETRAFAGIPTAHGANRRGITVPYIPFAQLAGWYISEGCVLWTNKRGKPRRCPRPGISQNEGPDLEDIKKLVELCGLTYSVRKGTSGFNKKRNIRNNKPNRLVTINSRLLGEYFIPLGDCYHKYIPEEFFAHPDLLWAVLEGIYRGDATKRDNMSWDKWTLFTTSRQLADDVHRAWTLLGRTATCRPYTKNVGQLNECAGFEVCAYVNNFYVFYRRDKRRIHTENVVDEPAYCFTIPNHRPVVRHDGQRPVITGQCMSNSKYQYSVYAGTPLTSENTIEVLWNRSSMTEWVMRCTGCGKHTYIDGTKALGSLGPECLNCRKALNPRHGFWVDMVKGAPIKGFHISQPIMPENVPAAWQPGQAEYDSAVERWQKLLYKQEAYGETRFLNECIGVSTSTGIRLITKKALEELVDESFEMTRLPAADTNTKIVATFAGVDWSGGGSEVKGHEGLFKSRTVLHIWGQRADGRLQAMYYKIFPNGHAVGWLNEIVELCNAWNVRMIIGDAGEGALANSMLRERLGAHRVIAVRYMNASKPMDWNPSALAYHCDRTTMIDNYARFLLHKQAVFPKLGQSKPAFDDILNVYEEVTANGRKVWKHSPVAPDDALHAQLFAWLGWRILTQNLQFNV